MLPNSSDMQILPFFFDEQKEIRTIVIDNNIWFVAKDIVLALDYLKFNSTLLDKIPEEWKDTKPIGTLGGIQNMAVLSESGLYFFLARSDKPKALPFQKWIAGEVLPSIRKTGNYSISQNIQLPEIGNSTEQIIELDKYFVATANLIDNLEKLKATTLYRLDKYILENKKFSPLETFKINLDSQYFLPTELGKMINKSAVEINLMIEKKGFQVKENGIWKLTDLGRDFGIVIVGKYNQIKWKMKTVL